MRAGCSKLATLAGSSWLSLFGRIPRSFSRRLPSRSKLGAIQTSILDNAFVRYMAGVIPKKLLDEAYGHAAKLAFQGTQIRGLVVVD
jgi:hypothetical protein